MGEVSLTRQDGSSHTFRLLVEYDGSQFMGWQVQPGMRTVQGVLEEVLARVLAEPVRISGAGRTDRGVHALGQVASFQTSSGRSEEEMQGAFSAWLPPDIVVREVSRAPEGFHARHSAVRRRYRYVLGLERTALDRDRCWFVRDPLGIGRMRKAARDLLGEHDFSEFTVARSAQENNRVMVYEAQFRRRGNRLVFEIEGNRFLRRMVRAVVGALVDVGRGRLDTDVVSLGLCSDEAMPPFAVAPAQGLYLVSVTYER